MRAKRSRRRGAGTPRSGADSSADPFELFGEWFRDAEKAGEPLPEAMALATATRDGRPSVRMVLNRGVSRNGFVFYTNYNSRKAADLDGNPRAAAVFHWPKLERQLRIEGRVQKLTRRESEDYFQTRPRESRLSAWASPQSATISGRPFLEEEFAPAGLAELAVGDGADADALLQRHRFPDAFVLEPRERGLVELAGTERLARLEQPLRPRQAADMLGAVRRIRLHVCHRILPLLYVLP